MSSKLDQGLDDIISSNRGRGKPRGRGGRRVVSRVKNGPVGGIQKNSKPARGALKATVPTGPTKGSGESKILVSNLVSGA